MLYGPTVVLLQNGSDIKKAVGLAHSLQSSRYNIAWNSSREVTQTSNLAPAGLAFMTESKASVLVAPSWRNFPQIRKGYGS